MTKKISEHFSEEEYRCSCCGQLPPQFRDDDGFLLTPYQFFFDSLEDIRTAWGKPMPIGGAHGGSGYRCAKHNAAVGGEPLSVHLFGLAVDTPLSNPNEVKLFVDIARSSAPALRKGWKKYLETGQCFVHLDCGYYIFPSPSVNFKEGVEW